ncbi:hypothetical protein NHF46_15625 [Arthrobacter alpinus]|nr:hypothetical protein [Arthrobacter alpinus]
MAPQDRDAKAGGTESGHAVEPSKDPSTDPVSDVSAALAGAAPLTVIVTNFHTVQGTAFERDLARLLVRTPELSLIVETRSVLEIEKVQLSTGLDVYVVDADDLTFSSAEASQFHEGTPLAAISDELNEHFQGLPITHRTARLATQGSLAPAANLAEHIIARVTDMVLVESVSARDQLKACRGPATHSHPAPEPFRRSTRPSPCSRPGVGAKHPDPVGKQLVELNQRIPRHPI